MSAFSCTFPHYHCLLAHPLLCSPLHPLSAGPPNCRPVLILFISAYLHFLRPAPFCNPENLGTISYYCFYSCPNVSPWFLYFIIISPGMWLCYTMSLSFLIMLMLYYSFQLKTLSAASPLWPVIISVFLVFGESHLQPLLQIGSCTQKFP